MPYKKRPRYCIPSYSAGNNSTVVTIDVYPARASASSLTSPLLRKHKLNRLKTHGTPAGSTLSPQTVADLLFPPLAVVCSGVTTGRSTLLRPAYEKKLIEDGDGDDGDDVTGV